MSPRISLSKPLLLLLLSTLAGCSGGLRSDAPPTQVYLLRMTADVPRADEPLTASLQVARPQAHPGLESDRLMLVQEDRRMSHIAGSRWAAELPEMVEALAVQATRATGAWSTVQDSLSPFSADYLLQITIRRFEADYTGDASGAPRILVSLDCTLGGRGNRRVVSSFVAEGSAAASANRLADIVAAFEAATNDALVTLAGQTVEAVKKSTSPSPR